MLWVQSVCARATYKAGKYTQLFRQYVLVDICSAFVSRAGPMATFSNGHFISDAGTPTSDIFKSIKNTTEALALFLW